VHAIDRVDHGRGVLTTLINSGELPQGIEHNLDLDLLMRQSRPRLPARWRSGKRCTR
jgi:hypothetical protein